jgi:ubiquinone/menaquinone biosynthesis C-methylase UbiE
MSIVVPRRRFSPTEPEMMDHPHCDPAMLREDLANLRRINKWFGGHSALLLGMNAVAKRIPPGDSVRILDLGTGSADHLPILIRRLKKSGRQVEIVGIEKQQQILEIARAMTSGIDEINIVDGDIRTPPFPDRSFDVVTASLVLHHHSFEDCVVILKEMKRLSKYGIVVNDLQRSWVGAGVTWGFTHAFMRNPMTLHDSTLSVLRAFTWNELSTMAKEAGLERNAIFRHPFFRFVLVGWTDAL